MRNRQHLHKVAILLAGLLLVSCSQKAEEGTTPSTDSDILSIMIEEMDPAADGIWQSAGWIITEEGEQELWPTTDEGWQTVVDSAERLKALSAELDAPVYSAVGKPWSLSLVRLTEASDAARVAAEARDKQGLFDAGGDIYRACLMCHLRYAREAELSGSDTSE
ncbi:MAG: hypothetical protein MRY72_10450 [Aquisalinus sp.]|nr:hypothetical protein [Aquisalinus sp.]